jgi:hypothetical protein
LRGEIDEQDLIRGLEVRSREQQRVNGRRRERQTPVSEAHIRCAASTVEEFFPLTTGAALRLITSEPVPVRHLSPVPSPALTSFIAQTHFG